MVQNMKIYVGHSSDLDFRDELYRPLKKSSLYQDHEVVLPHEDPDQIFDSRGFLSERCDLFIAEVSDPSTGLGIELGWADTYDVSVVAIHRKGSEISSSLKEVCDEIKAYEKPGEIPETVLEEIK